MKNNLRRLNAALRLFGVDNFYSVSIGHGGVRLQGKYNSDIAKLCNQLSFLQSITDAGFCKFERKSYTLILTD